MKKFLGKANAFIDEKLDSRQTPPSQQQFTPQQSAPQSRRPLGPPTADDVLRYRYHHGTNLGSFFCLEKWLTSSMFVEGAKGGSELDAVQAYVVYLDKLSLVC